METFLALKLIERPEEASYVTKQSFFDNETCEFEKSRLFCTL